MLAQFEKNFNLPILVAESVGYTNAAITRGHSTTIVVCICMRTGKRAFIMRRIKDKVVT